MANVDVERLKHQARARAFEAVWKLTLARLQALADECADSEIELSYEINPPPFGSSEDFVVFDWQVSPHSDTKVGVLYWRKVEPGRTVIGNLSDAPLDVRARVVNAADQIILEHKRYAQWLQQEVDKALRSKTSEGER